MEPAHHMDGEPDPIAPQRRDWVVTVWLVLLLVTGLVPLLASAGIADTYPEVRQYFPTADRFGEVEGKPPAAAVYQGGKVVGYVFHTKEVAPIPAYSGQPVDVLVAIDSQGRIVGTRVLEQHEPILLVGIPVQKLYDFVAQYVGKHATDRVEPGAGKKPGVVSVDAISSATVTAMVVNRTIMRAALKVAVSRKVVAPTAGTLRPRARIRRGWYRRAGWQILTGNGSIRRLHLTRDQVDAAFQDTAAADVERAPAGHGGDTFIDLYYTYLNAPTIGRNLLGDSQYRWLMSTLKPGEHAVAVLANGMYSFKGSGYVRGGIFDRLHLVQDGQQILFHDLDYIRLADVSLGGMPDFQEMAIFIVRAGVEFDPGQPWQIELLVRRQTGPVRSVFHTFSADYQLPVQYYVAPAAPSPAADEAIWIGVWRERPVQIALLAAGLVFLTLVMILQDWLVRFPRLLTYLRNGFLVYTLAFIGWYLLGQLSVVNVLTFINAVIHHFSWDTFLIDPTMFILWSFVAVSLLLWGRGVYCGWLCPFGALQKLVSQAAMKLRVPQWRIPPLVHERLWAIKYIILLVLFAVSLQSIGQAERYAEVEPFKTAITLHFARQWPFVLYAAGLVITSAFNCKFYCKYLCPLGAALAVPARLRLFDWLRRRKECGRPCQICAKECEIQAIADTGEINPNECHYCLDCQVTYWDDHKCPPLVERRKRHERAGSARAAVRKMEDALGAHAGLEDISIEVVPGQRRGRSRRDAP